ncbi:MAG TPA: hybrid sensor histidine kinase/response regulator [Kofleriaceae bacterium]|jgi:signal transduction histidine kinase|nr:hybrid sensor histidine kinase/response regulator [Kofleriaceae bacterium]
MSDPGKGPLVLYVDDERGNRVVFETSMKAEFNVRVASEPAEALQVLESTDVAVIVTDMRMPTMSGEELLRIAKERWPQTIRMVVTAYSDIEPILRAINEGLVARYIIKPWVRTELMQVLRWATEAWALSRDSAAVHRRLLETERLATLGSISGMLVHDLKQPLMSLAVNAELLKELADFAPVLRQALDSVSIPNRGHLIEMIDELGQVTDDIKTSIDHLNTLISSLRGFSTQRRPDPSTPISTDPLPILRHAMSVCQELAVKVRAQIGYDGPRELPRVRIPPTELTQVLINLVANGAQAVAARGSPNGRVSIQASESAGMLVLEVKDDGVGMTADVLKRVGTPFFTTRAQGTGLGLAQCQRLIGTAGGRLAIDSEPGKGTTVTITLPIAA